MPRMEQNMSNQNAAVAAIQFALETDDGLTFLRLWNYGEFDKTRRDWPDAPEDVYIGADPLHPVTAMPSCEVDMVAMLAKGVDAGQPLHVTGALDDVQGRLHLSMVNRLRRATGKPVYVIYT